MKESVFFVNVFACTINLWLGIKFQEPLGYALATTSAFVALWVLSW